MRKIAAALFLGLVSVRAHAAQEDFGAYAPGAAMGEAMTAAAEGVQALDYNPAGLASLRSVEFAMGYKRALISSVGRTDLDRTSLAVGAPVNTPPVRGAMGLFGEYTPVGNQFLDRTVGISYATHGFREFDSGTLDFGGSLKSISRSVNTGGSVTKAGVDIGGTFRMTDDRTVAMSVLNVNGPRMDAGGVPDRAPVIFKTGYSQMVNGFTWAADFTKREPSLGYGASNSVGSGFEYWIHTVQAGSFAPRAGLNLGSGNFASAGLGWRIMGAEAGYALQIPLASQKRYDNTVSVIYRFGRWDPEREYEKMLATEIRYRQDLTQALERSEEKQKELNQELQRLQEDIAALKRDLAAKSASESEARQRVQQFEDRQSKAREALEEVERQKRELAARSKESLYREDWGKYQKLKADGAPDLVLQERVRQILQEYKDSGVDLSEPNQELIRLQRNAQ